MILIAANLLTVKFFTHGFALLCVHRARFSLFCNLIFDGKACTCMVFMNELECERLALGLLGVVVTLSSVMT